MARSLALAMVIAHESRAAPVASIRCARLRMAARRGAAAVRARRSSGINDDNLKS
jgi:hypothetical protein